MLSFLYRLATQYEQQHGFRPNVLYINPSHFQCLKQALAEIHGLAELTQLLGMEVILTTDACQPHVAWSATNIQNTRVI